MMKCTQNHIIAIYIGCKQKIKLKWVQTKLFIILKSIPYMQFKHIIGLARKVECV